MFGCSGVVLGCSESVLGSSVLTPGSADDSPGGAMPGVDAEVDAAVDVNADKGVGAGVVSAANALASSAACIEAKIVSMGCIRGLLGLAALCSLIRRLRSRSSTTVDAKSNPYKQFQTFKKKRYEVTRSTIFLRLSAK